MKHMFAIAAAMLTQISLASADESLVRLDDSALNLSSALGKQINVRFAESFAKDRLPKADIDGLVVTETPEGKICLSGREQGLDPDAAGLKDFARADAGDVCVPLTDVSVRVTDQVAEGAPRVPFYSTDKKSCAWTWVVGQGIGVWTEDCTFDTGRWNIVYDDANDWFALQVDGSDPFAVVRQFRQNGGPLALLPKLKDKGLVPDDAECVFVQATEQSAPPGWTVWDVEPTGKRKETFEALPGDDIPEPPCGELGMAVDFAGYFMVHKDFPDRVVYVNLGQDGTMFDLGSVTLTK
jgi:hypothetical protein